MSENVNHNELTALAAVVSALVALVSATLGPWLSWKIAKGQAISTLRSTSRQQWLDALRNEVADYLGVLTEGGMKRISGELSVPDMHKLARELAQRLAKIELLLNPTEELHDRLCWLLKEAHSETWSPDVQPDLEQVRVRTDEALDVCKQILKTEWDRAKDGE